jgi:DNA-binding SARP family transcriptional activator
MGTLEIRLFGTFRLERDGQPLMRPSSRRVRDLLCFLLFNRDLPQSREHVAGLLWGDLGDRKARHCLNTALWRLHSVLGHEQTRVNPYLKVDAQSICFSTASDVWLDVAEFEARCASASQLAGRAPDVQAALYHQAVALYQGDLVVDCFEDWCLVERQRLQHRYLQALGWLLTHHSARKETDAAIDCGRRILAVDPLREEIHRDLIELYLAAEQPAMALRQYRTCETALSRELGIIPMPETQALHERIMRARAGTDRASRMFSGAAPAMPRDAGSERELAAALARLHEAGSTLEVARVQLASAMTLVEQALRRLDGAAVERDTSGAHGHRATARVELERATSLVASVVDDLRLVPADGEDRALSIVEP